MSGMERAVWMALSISTEQGKDGNSGSIEVGVLLSCGEGADQGETGRVLNRALSFTQE